MATKISQFDLETAKEESQMSEMATTRSMAKHPKGLLSPADDLLYDKLLEEGPPSDKMLQLWATEEHSIKQSETEVHRTGY